MLSDIDEPAAAPQAPRSGSYDGNRRRILVADDHAGHRALMIDLLTPLGFELCAARNGPECLELAPDFRPDLFLLDLSMPGMDGRELALRLRETATGQLPILFVSGEGDRTDAYGLRLDAEPALAGCAVLSKPVQLAALLREIAARLELASAPPGGPPGEAARAAEPAAALSASQTAELRRLAESGHVRRLRERLDALEREAPDLAPALRPLRAQLAAYRLEAFRAALDLLQDAG